MDVYHTADIHKNINVQSKGISKQHTHSRFHNQDVERLEKLKGRREGDTGNTSFTLGFFTFWTVCGFSELVTVDLLL